MASEGSLWGPTKSPPLLAEASSSLQVQFHQGAPEANPAPQENPPLPSDILSWCSTEWYHMTVRSRVLGCGSLTL